MSCDSENEKQIFKSKNHFKKMLILAIIILFAGSLVVKIGTKLFYYSQIKKINIRNYFHTNDTESLNYLSYNDKGSVTIVTNKVIDRIESNNNSDKYSVYTKDKFADENENFNIYSEIFTIDNNTILENRNNNISKPLFASTNKWNVNDINNSIAQITGLNKKVTTSAGTFERCIEVTTTNSTKDKKSYTFKDYYAPEFGIVLTEIKLPGSNSFIKYYELISIDDNDNNIKTDTSDADTLLDNSEASNINLDVTSKYSESNTSGTVNDDGEKLIYTNQKYNFTLDLPYSWKDKFTISEVNSSEEADKIIVFNLTLDGKNYGYIFYIIILKPQYDENYVKNSPMIYINKINGITFAYGTTESPSQEILNNANLLNIIQNMVNNDVPQIIKSIKFN